VEERSGAHRVTQRLLIDPDGERPPEGTDRTEAPETPAAPLEEPTATPTVPRGPSDTELRKRQRAWRGERARFEASRKSASLAEERLT